MHRTFARMRYIKSVYLCFLFWRTMRIIRLKLWANALFWLPKNVSLVYWTSVSQLRCLLARFFCTEVITLINIIWLYWNDGGTCWLGFQLTENISPIQSKCFCMCSRGTVFYVFSCWVTSASSFVHRYICGYQRTGWWHNAPDGTNHWFLLEHKQSFLSECLRQPISQYRSKSCRR